MNKLSIIGGSLMATIGFGGIVLGVYRMFCGETMHGLANFIIGGLVAMQGIGVIKGYD